MSSWGAQIRKRINELGNAGQDVKKILVEVAEGATIEAVRIAEENTPPNDGTLKGTNTRSGQMANSWQKDSITKPIVSGNIVKTVLANNMQYASYVNDGHNVHEHFVPGLVVNEASGLLEQSPDGSGGIMVGTKTTFVQGKYMKQKAIGKYRDTVRKELSKRVREVLK